MTWIKTAVDGGSRRRFLNMFVKLYLGCREMVFQLRLFYVEGVCDGNTRGSYTDCQQMVMKKEMFFLSLPADNARGDKTNG